MISIYIKRTILTAFLVSTTFCLSGCSASTKEKELASFSQSIADFSSQIKTIDGDIDQIDITSEDASKDILAHLDTLNEAFNNLAALEVPEQYASIETLADQASENMSQAVTFYHSAFDTDAYNEQDAQVAYEYYTRAMTRVNYIGMILEGEVPEGENVTVYETNPSSELLNKLND